MIISLDNKIAIKTTKYKSVNNSQQNFVVLITFFLYLVLFFYFRTNLFASIATSLPDESAVKITVENTIKTNNSNIIIKNYYAYQPIKQINSFNKLVDSLTLDSIKRINSNRNGIFLSMDNTFFSERAKSIFSESNPCYYSNSGYDFTLDFGYGFVFLKQLVFTPIIGFSFRDNNFSSKSYGYYGKGEADDQQNEDGTYDALINKVIRVEKEMKINNFQQIFFVSPGFQLYWNPWNTLFLQTTFRYIPVMSINRDGDFTPFEKKKDNIGHRFNVDLGLGWDFIFNSSEFYGDFHFIPSAKFIFNKMYVNIHSLISSDWDGAGELYNDDKMGDAEFNMFTGVFGANFGFKNMFRGSYLFYILNFISFGVNYFQDLWSFDNVGRKGTETTREVFSLEHGSYLKTSVDFGLETKYGFSYGVSLRKYNKVREFVINLMYRF